MSKSPTAKAKYALRQASLAKLKQDRFWERQRRHDEDQLRKLAQYNLHPQTVRATAGWARGDARAC